MKIIGVIDLLISIMMGFLLVLLINEIERRKLAPVVTEYIIPDNLFTNDEDCSFIISSESDIKITYTMSKNIPKFDVTK